MTLALAVKYSPIKLVLYIELNKVENQQAKFDSFV
jgi:hypothetical protein